MKPAVTLGISALLVACSALFYFLTPAPAPTTENYAPPDAAEAQAPEYVPPAELPLPRIAERKNPLPCLKTEGERYKGDKAEAFRKDPREGVVLYNACADKVIIRAVKANATSVAYVSSILPIRVVYIGRRVQGVKQPDRLVVLAHKGERCDEMDKPEGVCRMLAIKPEEAVFFPLPMDKWFAIQFLDRRAVTGYIPAPIDPKAPPKPRESVKMPDKGFKFFKSGP